MQDADVPGTSAQVKPCSVQCDLTKPPMPERCLAVADLVSLAMFNCTFLLVKSQAIDLKCELWLLGKLILIILYRCLHSLSRSVQQLRTSFQDHAVWKPLMKVRTPQQLAPSL